MGQRSLCDRRKDYPDDSLLGRCARLMGFDDPERPRFEIPVSDTQAYKQFGNAVAVPVVQAIAEYMSHWLT